MIPIDCIHHCIHLLRSITTSPQGGNLSDALVDLTGGVSAHLDLTLGGYMDDFEKRKQLFKMMRKEMDEHALMCCAISVSFLGEFLTFFIWEKKCDEFLIFAPSVFFFELRFVKMLKVRYVFHLKSWSKI